MATHLASVVVDGGKDALDVVLRLRRPHLLLLVRRNHGHVVPLRRGHADSRAPMARRVLVVALQRTPTAPIAKRAITHPRISNQSSKTLPDQAQVTEQLRN